MSGTKPDALWTVERALRELPHDARWEIDAGRLVAHEPPSYFHGSATASIIIALGAFVQASRLGCVVGGDPGFRLARDPDTLRAPDVAFVSAARDRQIRQPDTFPEVPPDLAVEVLSRHDRRTAVRRKVAQYLAHGVRSVWVCDPRKRTLERHLADGTVHVHAGDDSWVEDPTLPGFRVRLGDLLPDPRPDA